MREMVPRLSTLNRQLPAPPGYRYVTVSEGGGKARFEPVAEPSFASCTFCK
jgi:hypothetical protein